MLNVTWKVLPFCRLGEVPGVLAPDGTDVNATLCCARLSWSSQVIVVPGATVRLAGAKFSPVAAPCGMVIVEPLDEPEPVEVLLQLVVLVLAVTPPPVLEALPVLDAPVVPALVLVALV